LSARLRSHELEARLTQGQSIPRPNRGFFDGQAVMQDTVCAPHIFDEPAARNRPKLRVDPRSFEIHDDDIIGLASADTGPFPRDYINRAGVRALNDLETHPFPVLAG